MNKMALNSKMIIAETLLNLMKDNSFSEITISEIAAYSNLSRSSFYRNFSSKIEVLSFYNMLMMDDYFQIIKERGIHTFYGLVNFYFEFWIPKREYLFLLKKNNIIHTLFEIQRNELVKKLPYQEILSHCNKIDETIIDLFFIGGLWNVLNYYLDFNIDLDAKKMASDVIYNLRGYIKFIEK